MMLNKIIISTIFVCFIVFTMTPSSSAINSAVKPFVGQWNCLGLILPSSYANLNITCCCLTIIERYLWEPEFIEVIRYKQNGKPKRLVGTGRIINSELYLSFSGTDEVIYSVMSYNEGTELILHKRYAASPYYGLLSRATFAQASTKAVFEGLAGKTDDHARYINHKRCH